MTLSRRSFLTAAAAAGLSRSAGSALASENPTGIAGQVPADRFDPWIEVDAQAIRDNVSEVSRLAGNRPILAVIKNNAYGLDLITAARVLEPLPQITGLAVVKAAAAMSLREAGIETPVLHMGIAGLAEGAELARLGVTPSLFTEGARERTDAMSRALGGPVDAHLYLDTGMGRMGMPYHRALPWMLDLSRSGSVRIQGAFMAFTEDPEFDPEQLARFTGLMEQARSEGLEPGLLHAASSSGVFELPAAHLDLVRPGIALWGGYPNDYARQKQEGTLRCAFRLRARVVRVERLRAGDGVSYGRNYVAQEPTWIATIPAGHTDGVPRAAVHGARVLIRNQTYPVIGAVSASHCIVELGRNSPVGVGDPCTVLGPDHPDIVPDHVSQVTGASVYDLFMHLNPQLPRILV